MAAQCTSVMISGQMREDIHMPSADWSTGLCAAHDAVRIIASETTCGFCSIFFFKGGFFCKAELC